MNGRETRRSDGSVPRTSGETVSTAGPWALSLDAIFELLSRRRRRYALYALHRDGETGIELDELARRVRRLEAADHEGTDEEVRSALEEHHLPKLVGMHVIEIDDRTEMIRYRGQPSLDKWIEHAESEEGKRPDE